MPGPSEYNFGLEPENPIHNFAFLTHIQKVHWSKKVLEPLKSFGLQVLMFNSQFFYWQKVGNVSIGQIQQPDQNYFAS